MKRIKISVINPPDPTSPYLERKLYSLVLDGTRINFSSRKKAMQYLAQTNRKLNLKLHEINQILTMVYQEYRNKWFYLGPIQTSKVNADIQFIETSLTKLVTKGYSVNYNYYAYSDMTKILSTLTDIITVLQQCSLEDKTYTEVYRFSFLKDWINRISAEISIK